MRLWLAEPASLFFLLTECSAAMIRNAAGRGIHISARHEESARVVACKPEFRSIWFGAIQSPSAGGDKHSIPVQAATFGSEAFSMQQDRLYCRAIEHLDAATTRG